jgi:hypothetical protein
MYTIRNITEAASGKEKDKLDVLIINEFDDSYVESLCLTNHNFYLMQNIKDLPQQWNSQTKPHNLNIVANYSEIRHVDCIVCFNRGNAYNIASNISAQFHVNLINVDFASSQLIFPSPINAKINIPLQEAVTRQGVISVGTSKHVTASWANQRSGFQITIPHYYEKFEPTNRSKILIDPNIPQDTLTTLPVQLSPEDYTTDKNEAGSYLHLWTHVNKLAIDCMASDIPVVCLDSPDIKDLAFNRACIVLPDLEHLKLEYFKEKVLQLADQHGIKINAKKYIEKVHDNDFFLECWDKLFRYASNLMYLRG